MCGRFVLSLTAVELQLALPWLTVPAQLIPRYNIAPGQPVAVVPNDGRHRVDLFNWGLIPSWAQDEKIGYRLINARAETLADKPSFRSAFRRRRCLIPADGFYEWQTASAAKTKIPMLIRLRSGEPFAFAGLWEEWHATDGSQILSCTIITTTPNELLAPIHNRMPVIVPPAAYEQWLDPAEQRPQSLQPLLAPYPAEQMEAHAVSREVNSPKNDYPALLEPV